VASQRLFGSLEVGIWILPFDLAQGGESFDFAQDREPVENSELVEVVERLVEPFDICYLALVIFYIYRHHYF
jgi:hypothetical protein